MKRRLLFALIISVFSLSACNNTSRILYNDFKYALFEQNDVVITPEQVIASPYDYIYLTIDGLPQALMVLGYVKAQQQHWVSSDSAVVVLQAGRFIASSGLPQNLLFTTNVAADPVAQGLSEFRKRNTWQRQTDWDTASGYELKSRFQPEQHETLTILDQNIPTVRIDETVRVTATGETLRNAFWYDLASGTLVRSVQQPAPGLPKMEVIYLSEIARLYGLKPTGAS